MGKLIFILLVFGAFVSLPLFSEDYTNNPAYIAQNGTGTTAKEAEQNALASLSRFFQMSISVQASEHTSVVDSRSQSTLTEDISVTSETELFAVHYTKAKFDKKQKIYEVTAYIDRDEAWRIYEPRLQEAIRPFEKLYANAESQSDAMAQIVGFSKAAKNASETELSKKCDFATILNPDGAAQYESARNRLSELPARIKRLSSQCTLSVRCETDYENRVNQGARSVFSQLGISVGDAASSDYECAIFIEENAQSLAAGTFFAPSFKIEIKKGEQMIFSGGGQIKKVGAKNESVAKQRAYSALSDAVKRTLHEEFASF